MYLSSCSKPRLRRVGACVCVCLCWEMGWQHEVQPQTSLQLYLYSLYVLFVFEDKSLTVDSFSISSSDAPSEAKPRFCGK